MRVLKLFTRRMVSWDGLCRLWSNSSPPLWPTRKSSRKGSYLLGKTTTITTWVFSFFCFHAVKWYLWIHTTKVLTVNSYDSFLHFIWHLGLFVDSSLGHSTVCPSQSVRWGRRWLGREMAWWDSSLSIQAWKLGRFIRHMDDGLRSNYCAIHQEFPKFGLVWLGKRVMPTF